MALVFPLTVAYSHVLGLSPTPDMKAWYRYVYSHESPATRLIRMEDVLFNAWLWGRVLVWE